MTPNLLSVPVSILSRLRHRFNAAQRALDLACLIHDDDRINRARFTLLEIYRESVEKRKLWWIAFDCLIQNKRACIRDEERQVLIADLEHLFLIFIDISNSNRFDPYAAQDTAKRLISYYNRLHKSDDVKRLHTAIGRTFEHFASLGDANVASAALQIAENAYRDARLPVESRHVRLLMEEKICQARDLVMPIEAEITIPKEDMDAFLEKVVVHDVNSTFARLATEFLPRRSVIEEQVQKTLEETPLLARIPQMIMSDNHMAAKIGSVEDDLSGRVIHYTKMSFGFSTIWLQRAIEHTIETLDIVPGHFVWWANRLNLFNDLTFLIEGVEAWYQGDFVKAVHVLIPQVEHGLRSIANKLGQPVTKPHSTVADVSVAIGMGDILYKQELSEALGANLSLYLLALYADPRGMNLRNSFAHGLLRPPEINGDLTIWLIHTLIVFGIWEEIATQRY